MNFLDGAWKVCISHQRIKGSSLLCKTSLTRAKCTIFQSFGSKFLKLLDLEVDTTHTLEKMAGSFIEAFFPSSRDLAWAAFAARLS